MSPLISAILASIIVYTASRLWLKKHPYNTSYKDYLQLKEKYKTNFKITNIVVLSIISILISLIQIGVISNHDWRYGMIGIGAACASPLCTFSIPPKGSKSNFTEALTVYSMKNKVPVGATLFTIVFGCVLSAIGLFYVLA